MNGYTGSIRLKPTQLNYSKKSSSRAVILATVQGSLNFLLVWLILFKRIKKKKKLTFPYTASFMSVCEYEWKKVKTPPVLPLLLSRPDWQGTQSTVMNPFKVKYTTHNTILSQKVFILIAPCILLRVFSVPLKPPLFPLFSQEIDWQSNHLFYKCTST